MAREMEFRKPRLGEYKARGACVYASVRQRVLTVHATEYLGQLGNGLELYCKRCISVIKI